MKKALGGFIVGSLVTFLVLQLLDSKDFKKSKQVLPKALVQSEGRYYLQSQVNHLKVFQKNGRLCYGFESWDERRGLKGTSMISSADDWNASEGWWIYSEDGVWFWIFDGDEELRLWKVTLEGTANHSPSRMTPPELVVNSLPTKVTDKNWPELSEQGVAAEPDRAGP